MATPERLLPDRENALVALALDEATGVFTMTMRRAPDNRFDPAFVAAIHAALDCVEERALTTHRGQPCALVTASAGERIWSNGLDVEYLFASGDAWFICDHYLALLSRLLTFPVATVAAIGGHAFAGGLLFALCHDYRVVRADRGFLCLNEIELPSSLHPGMAWLARAKLPPQTFHRLIFEARRFGGQHAVDAQLADAAAEDVLPVAHKLACEQAGKVARAGPIVAHLKSICYQDVVEKLAIRQEIDMRKFVKPKRKAKM